MTAWVHKYLECEYKDGARGEEVDGVVYHDCWSLVRHVIHHELGGRLMPSWGYVRSNMSKEFTKAYRAESESMEQCAPEVGAIAAVFRGSLMVHVGVVLQIDGRLAVLDINPKARCRWRTICDFEAPYAKVIYYRDRSSLSKQD